jgi:hypothetical protein
MAGTSILVLVLLGWGSGGDVSDLVAKLGSSRFTEREEAATQLTKLGRDALPALREAMNSKDPEVRSRAAALVEKIDQDLMLQPTWIKLDFQDQSIEEVAQAIGEQTGITLKLEPANLPTWKTRKITLREPRPLPFWQAMDRFCEAGELQRNHGMAGPMLGRGAVFRLFAGPTAPMPTSDHGPFRIQLAGLHHHRDLVLGQYGPFPADGFGRVVPRGVLPAGPAGAVLKMPAGANASPPAALGHLSISDRFYADMQIFCEPRLILVQSHDLKLTEAVDDRGQSLLAHDTDAQMHRFAGYYGMGAGTVLQIPVHLKHPDQAGKQIKTLRGVLPVTVAARKPEPLVVALKPENLNKPARNDEVTVTVHEIKTDPNSHQTTLDLTVRTFAAASDQPGAVGPMNPDFASRVPNLAVNQLEVLDTQGRPVNGFPNFTQVQPDQVRLTMTLLPSDDAGPPAQLRYFSLTQASTEVPFAFENLPMP